MKSISKTEADSPKKPIWESLLDRASIKKEERKQQIEQKKKKEEELDPECTFKPQILNTVTNDKPFYERQQQWWLDVQQKRKEKLEGLKDKDIEGLSFQPQLGPDPQITEVDIKNNKGTETFIQRQEKARKLKEEKKALLNNPYSHLSSEKKAVITSQNQSFSHPISKEYESVKKAERIEFSKAVNISQEFETQSQTLQQQSKMQLGVAMKMLHNQLYNIKFNSEF